MAMIRPLFLLVIQRVDVGDGVGVGDPPGVKMTVSNAARRSF